MYLSQDGKKNLGFAYCFFYEYEMIEDFRDCFKEMVIDGSVISFVFSEFDEKKMEAERRMRDQIEQEKSGTVVKAEPEISQNNKIIGEGTSSEWIEKSLSSRALKLRKRGVMPLLSTSLGNIIFKLNFHQQKKHIYFARPWLYKQFTMVKQFGKDGYKGMGGSRIELENFLKNKVTLVKRDISEPEFQQKPESKEIRKNRKRMKKLVKKI